MYQFELKITTSQNQWQCSKMVNQSNIRKKKLEVVNCHHSHCSKPFTFSLYYRVLFCHTPSLPSTICLELCKSTPILLIVFQQNNSESRLGMCGFEPKKNKENPTMLSSQGTSHVIPHLSLVPYFPRGPTGLWHVWINYVLSLFVD